MPSRLFGLNGSGGRGAELCDGLPGPRRDQSPARLTALSISNKGVFGNIRDSERVRRRKRKGLKHRDHRGLREGKEEECAAGG
jgi:hypothetical protein